MLPAGLFTVFMLHAIRRLCWPVGRVIRGPAPKEYDPSWHEERLTVRLWDLETCRLLATCTGHRDWINAIAFLTHRKLLVSAGREQ